MQREITISSVDCIGKDYKEVIQEFKSAGFINISMEESEDLEYEELNKKDTVITIKFVLSVKVMRNMSI